jgi:hypothetical protein
MREALRGAPIEAFIAPEERTDRPERLCLQIWGERRCPRSSIIGPDGQTADGDDDDDDGGR